jgi:hypothetical protein
MRRQRRSRVSALLQIALTLFVIAASLLVLVGVLPAPVGAAPPTVPCSASALITAITAANTSSAADQITLTPGCTYTLTEVHASTKANGPNGLPRIEATGGPLTIVGNGATIMRASSKRFRLLEVAPGATLTLTDLTLRGGFLGAFNGGAILNAGTLTLAGVILRDNCVGADGQSALGGALSNRGSATIRQSVFLHNIASVSGGAIHHAGSTLLIENTSILENTAQGSSGRGAGIMIVNAPLTLNNVSVIGNAATGTRSTGGGLHASGTAAIITVTNSLITANRAASKPNCAVPGFSAATANNLQHPGSDCSGFTRADPQLQRDAGALWFAPGVSSPAHNRGNRATCAQLDQRGVVRASDDACDLGAIEFGDGRASIDFNDSRLADQAGADALAALTTVYAARGVTFDAAVRLETNGADVTAYSAPGSAALLINFATPMRLVQIAYPEPTGAAQIVTARDMIGTALAIESTAATIVGTAASRSAGQISVQATCVRSLQVENLAASFRADDLTFVPEMGLDADNNGIVDRCEAAQIDPFVVTNSNDSGPGSLRAAILAANTQAGLQTIRFAIPGAQVHVITLLSALPPISEPLIINGLSQPGASCATWPPTPQVELRGAPGVPVGLDLAGGQSLVRGLALHSFSTAVQIGSAENALQCNLIGTTATGAAGASLMQRGVAISGDANLIGSVLPVAGNLISAQQEAGIGVDAGQRNQFLGNRLVANTQGIRLGNGANNDQAAPQITTALPDFPTLAQTNLQGWLLTGQANRSYRVQLFASSTCAPGGIAAAQTFLTELLISTDADGIAPFSTDLAERLPDGTFVSATATDADGNTSALALCAPVGPDNTVWYQALPLSAAAPSLSQPIALSEQVRWYYVDVEPLSRLTVNLTNLPAGYDLALFNDLGARAAALEAAAAGDFAATLATVQTQLDYTAVEAGNFIPNTLASELFSPAAFSSRALAPETFSPSLLDETAISPFKVSPFKVSPFKTSPFKVSPFKASPFKVSPFKTSPFKASDLASIVIDTGLLSYTELAGTLPRSLNLNTYNSRGRVYIAVYGRNGAFDPVQPFTVTAQSSASGCAGIVPPAATLSGLAAQAVNAQTLFLTDLRRLPGTPAELAQLQTLLEGFRTRSEIQGVLADVSQDARVVAAQTQADAAISCPEAQNLVADEIKRIVTDYRALNPQLRYVVLIGGDQVIPFFRYPDQALLGHESGFYPPVQNDSSAEAALRLGYILGQDEYGARFTISFRSTRLAIPDLPVGRLVEQASDAITLIEQYLATDGVITPQRSFVSGYDFHYDSANVIAESLRFGTAAPVDTLLSPSTDSYQLPGTWTADDLQTALASQPYDLLYLAGHFSDGALQAADYASALRTADLSRLAPDRLAGALVVSPGCHSGYNTPDSAAILGATDQPDWAQFFAQRGTTLVAGTGYQYGDTEFTQFAEELYSRFFTELRIDRVPNNPDGDAVAVGDALVIAKQRYLLDAAQIRGIDKKTLTISALFGLPMTQVRMQGDRLSPPVALPQAISTSALAALGAPNDLYRLNAQTISVDPELAVETRTLTSLNDGASVAATYLRGATPNDLTARPGEPVLPLTQFSLAVPNQQIRGMLFLGGSYRELRNVLPLLGAPATELRGVQMGFPSEAFYPETWWTLNQMAQLTGADSAGTTRMQLTPAQFRADPEQIRGTIRYYDQPLAFRIFTSDQTVADERGVNPMLSGAPAIPVVQLSREGSLVRFVVAANGGGVPLREVWITYTAEVGPLDDQWQSIQLMPSSIDPTRWEGSYAIPEGTEGFSFFVQAVNAVGFTAINTNLGLYYQAGGLVNGQVIDPPPPPVAPTNPAALATTLLLDLPINPIYGQPVSVTAAFSAASPTDLSGLPITLSVGTQTVSAQTNAAGQAQFSLTLFSTGAQSVQAFFGGTAMLQPASASATIEVAKQQPTLSVHATPEQIRATLSDSSGGIRAARLYLSIGGSLFSERTNPDGSAFFPLPTLAPGTYPFSVSYLQVPTASGFVFENDPRYLPVLTTGELKISNPEEPALYRARQQGNQVYIERNVALAGLNDHDPDGDGWALVARTNGTRDNGDLCGFMITDGIPYAIIYNRNQRRGDRCILVTPSSLERVVPGRAGGTGGMTIVADPVACER